ncbi:MAG: GtrA family protein [Kiritimatiellia bacterium]
MAGSFNWVALGVALLPFAACVGLLSVVVLGERLPWFGQLVKYGSVGVIATYVQTGVFYWLGTTCLQCLGPDDVAVRILHFAASDVSDGVRAFRFAVATGVGFTVANAVCWFMSRRCVFQPGKFPWAIEFGMFFGAALIATLIAMALSSALIRWAGLMTTIAVGIEVVVSFFVNFFARKFFIFKG